MPILNLAVSDIPEELFWADDQGWLAAGSTAPNPPVGCVILDAQGSVVGRGHTQPVGGDHAEVQALRQAGARARGGHAFVTLEPCNHTGRTGPCSHALAEAGVEEVTFLFADPGADEGGGAAYLEAAGVRVQGPFLTPWHNGPQRFSPEIWLRARQLDRPHVTLKFASTLNGMAAATDKTSQWITGATARQDVHHDREHREAILVGTGTVLADDPQLTARPEGQLSTRQPLRACIGTHHFSGREKIFQPSPHGPAGIQLHTQDLRQGLAELGKRGISDVLVEGGPKLAGAFLAADLVDEIRAYLAPAWLAQGLGALGSGGISETTIGDIQRFRTRHVERVGEDILWLMQRS